MIPQISSSVKIQHLFAKKLKLTHSYSALAFSKLRKLLYRLQYFIYFTVLKVTLQHPEIVKTKTAACSLILCGRKRETLMYRYLV